MDKLLARMEDREVRAMANLEPKELRFRAVEYLMYGNFPRLVDHTDGPTNVYTGNYLLLAPEEYDGIFKLNNNTISSIKDEDKF